MNYPPRAIKRTFEPLPAAEADPGADAPSAAPHARAAVILKTVGTVLTGAARPALVAALGLLAVWLVGRLMEAIHGNAIFDPSLTGWLGRVVFALLIIWAIGWGVAAAQALRRARDVRLAALGWIFLAALLVIVLVGFGGYRISSAGLLTTLAGAAEPSAQATFQLFKFHSLNPLLAVNLAAAKLAGLPWGVESLSPYVWSWNALFAFSIWSVAYGIVLLLQRDQRGPKSVHLLVAVFGLLGLIILKSLSDPTTEQLIVIQAFAALMLVFQVLLAYAVLRVVAAGPVPAAAAVDPFAVRPSEPAPAAPRRFTGLPPAAVTLLLALFLVVPVLADLQRQHALTSASGRLVRQLPPAGEGAAPAFVAVAAVSIRSGPADGDAVLAILPQGTRVNIVERKNGWVNIGNNHWVPDRFLRPLEPG